MPQIDLGKIVGDPGPQGPRGLQGNPGEKGETGSPGPGVAAGGAANQVLVKHSGTNFDTMWVDAGSLLVFAGVQYALAIVADGNTHPAIADGQFVYVRNHSTLAEGLYKASEAISENGALSTSNLTADSAGGLNDLQAQVTTLNDKIAVTEVTLADSIAIVANGDTHAAITSGQYVYVKNHGSLADGLYKATAAIGTNATLSTSNLTADGNGGLNDLKGQVDSLNSKITAHTIGTYVDIIGYNTTSNKFTCPSDGYIRVKSGTTDGNVVAVDVNGIDVWACCIANNKSAYNTLFVRAGMQAYVYVNEGPGAYARFSPLT